MTEYQPHNGRTRSHDDIEPRHLLELLPSSARGGVEEYSLIVAKAAAARGWRVSAAFHKCEGTASLIHDFEEAGVAASPLELVEAHDGQPARQRVGRELANVRRTMRVLRRVRPDVVHLVLPWPSLALGSMLALALLRCPTVVTFQLVANISPVSRTLRRVYAWCRRRGQRWVAISDNNHKLVCDAFGMSDGEVAVIRNGARLPDAAPKAAREALRTDVRRELGLAAGSRILLTVARLSDQKGHALLIPVVAAVVRQYPDVTFVWVGDGERRELFARMLTEHGGAAHVVMTGFRRDVQRLMQAADLFVFPTLYEGLPFALLEAMAARLPIVASDASSIPEVIEHGVHGLLFRTGEVGALERTILDALRDPARLDAMAGRAQERVALFSEERMLEDTLALLSATADNDGQPARI